MHEEFILRVYQTFCSKLITFYKCFEHFHQLFSRKHESSENEITKHKDARSEPTLEEK